MGWRRSATAAQLGLAQKVAHHTRSVVLQLHDPTDDFDSYTGSYVITCDSYISSNAVQQMIIKAPNNHDQAIDIERLEDVVLRWKA